MRTCPGPFVIQQEFRHWWNAILSPTDKYVSSSIKESPRIWLARELQRTQQFKEFTYTATSLIGFTLWRIWKARNDFVFSGTRPEPRIIVQQIAHNTSEFLEVQANEKKNHILRRSEGDNHQPRQQKKPPNPWSFPPLGYIKCNVDAAFKEHSKQAASGHIARDSNGNILHGSARSFSSFSPLAAETASLREVVAMVHNFNWDKVIFESDNLQLIRACRGEIELGEVKHMVEDIKAWRRHHRVWCFNWSSRIGNQSAHLIVAAQLNKSLPPNWVYSTPYAILRQISKDTRIAKENLATRTNLLHRGNEIPAPQLLSQLLAPPPTVVPACHFWNSQDHGRPPD